jgi:uncharacterized protein (TIGR03435 family)
MQDMDDNELLRRYALGGSEEAFAVLVSRYVNLVYSVALRHVGNPHHAQEITQAVFVILARKAHSLRQGTLLPGWLHKTAWFAADNFLKTEMRRRSREREAHMQSLLNEPESDAWAQIAPLLDTALDGLSDMDRNAVVLRFFNGRRLSEVGAAMGTSEEAAKKRVNRAVEKLRRFFTQRGVVLPAAALTAAISAYSVQAAPAGLAASATGMVTSGSTLALIKATLNTMVWTKLKTSIATGAAILLAAGIGIGIVSKVRSSSIEDAIRNTNTQSLQKAPAVLVLRPTRYPSPTDRGAQSRTGFVAQNMGLNWLFSFAYDYGWWRRVILPADAPPGTYDLLLTLTDNPKEALRQEIKRQLGLVAHRESRMTDVLVLEVNPATGARLKISEGGNRTVSFSGWQASGVRKLVLTNQPVSLLTRILEGHLGLPVFDRTESTANCDVMLEWNAQTNAKSEEETIRQAIAAQLGLRLVPGRESVEVLVVERTL